MSYQELKIIQYHDYANVEKEYQRRINGFGTYVTHLFPYVLKNSETRKSEFPLFSVPLPEIQLLMQDILEHSRQIEQVASKLPQVAHSQYYREQLARAVISSNEIEGVHTTRKEVSDAISAVENQKGNVRLRSTVNMYLDILESEKMNISRLSDIREIYDGLVDGEIKTEDLPDGEIFRNQAVMVGKKHRPPGEESQINQQMEAWIDFINDHTFPFLLRASLGHFFFENTHPFYDGNGRTGRYIFSRYLSKKLDKFSGLIISQKINENRKKYADAFEISEVAANRAEGTFFVRTMLEFIKEGQEEILKTLHEKLSYLENIERSLASRTDLEQYVLFLLYQSQIFTDTIEEGIKDTDIIEMSKNTSFSARSVKEILQTLQDEGEIELVTQRPKRHRIHGISE